MREKIDYLNAPSCRYISNKMDNTNSKGCYGLDMSKYPPNMGKPWFDDDTLKLLQNVRKKKTLSEIAEDHGRTEGGITARLRHIAFDYHKEGRSIEVIEKFTGLSKEDINDLIQKRNFADTIRERKKAEKESKKPVKQENVENVTMKDLINTLKSIDQKLTILLERSA